MKERETGYTLTSYRFLWDCDICILEMGVTEYMHLFTADELKENP